MKIELSIWERVQLGLIIGGFRNATILQVDLGLSAMKAVELTIEEKVQIGWSEPAPFQYTWNFEISAQVEIGKDAWLLVQEVVKNHVGWPIDERSSALYKKITEGKEESDER